MRSVNNSLLVLALLVAGLLAQPGCAVGTKGSLEATTQPIPEPISLILPQTIRLHPFTGTRTFDEHGGIRGIDVRMEADDAYGDPTKAFGEFRFEMYDFAPNNVDPKGKRIATWTESLIEPQKNLLHWDKITRTYEFKLQWDNAIPVGKRFVLVAYFSSPFTPRLDTQRVFISGQ